MSSFKLCLLCSVLIVKVDSAAYSWRYYNGTIPKDAVVGGRDANGDNIYIGQAPIENTGMLVVEIYPGQRTVEVPYYGYSTKKVTFGVRILCGSKHLSFAWLRTDSDNIHVSLIGKHSIIGGYENVPYIPDGFLYIGRISYKNEIKIGKVTAYSVDEAMLYFLHKGKVLTSKAYEVLISVNEQKYML